jgi:hypothetical protein
MKNPLLEIEAILSNATAELSMSKPKCEKAKKGIDVARNMLLDLANKEAGQNRLTRAKRKLLNIYLGMRESEFTDSDMEIFSMLVKEFALEEQVERARKNN